MNDDLMLKLERASRDRDFFILNKARIEKSYLYLEDVLSKYIDVCCMKFKTFSANKTSYIYGSIVTLGAAFVLSNKQHFDGVSGNALEYLCRDIFPLFMEQYNTTTLVSDRTQIHMLKGYVEEYQILFKKDESKFIKIYINQILKYCCERKCDGYSDKDVEAELLPKLIKILQ